MRRMVSAALLTVVGLSPTARAEEAPKPPPPAAISIISDAATLTRRFEALRAVCAKQRDELLELNRSMRALVEEVRTLRQLSETASTSPLIPNRSITGASEPLFPAGSARFFGVHPCFDGGPMLEEPFIRMGHEHRCGLSFIF